MAELVFHPHRARLVEKLAESLSAPIPRFTARRVRGPLSLPGKATAVLGMRRVGKTTFLHQLRSDRIAQGVEPDRLVHVNFEDERLAGLSVEQLGILAEEYYRRFPARRQLESVTWFLDELQVVPGWERFVRRLLDSEKVEIFLSGSSAALLGRELATAMRGRAWEVLLHPFSFEEFLRHHGIPIPDNAGFLSPPERSGLERGLIDYLTVGGFPEAQGLDTPTRRRLLRDYVDVTMLRDVIERHGVPNVTAFRWLVRHLLSNPAAMFSVEKFYRDLKSQGLRVSKDTLHDLVAHLEDCYLVRNVWVEAGSERRRMVNPRKSYPVDPGLIPVFDRAGRANLGHALETAVLVELERRRNEVTYVRTPSGREVDFLAIAPDGSRELIQVCADTTEPKTEEREMRALEEAMSLFPEATCRLLTLTADVAATLSLSGVRVQPAYEWLLGSSSRV